MFVRVLLTILGLVSGVLAGAAHAQPHLVVDLTNDRVLAAHQARHPWHPASLTKLMTAYVAFKAIRDGEFTPASPVMMTWLAERQSPSKMFYPAGTLIPLRDALAMLTIKSANDVAMAIAQTVGGSTEGFARRMNDEAARLGMTDSYFANPHGLHDPRQVTSARDMALLVRALARDFPDWAWLFRQRSIQDQWQGKPRVLTSFNRLLGRFPGADGMKTGFVCASGYNIAASATRDGRRVLAIVMGRLTLADRANDVAELLGRAHEGSLDPVNTGGVLAEPVALDAYEPEGAVPAEPRDMRPQACTNRPPPKAARADALPAGVAGPPAPPRRWLAAKAVATQPLLVGTAGRRDPWPNLAALERPPVPNLRPPLPTLDDAPVMRSAEMPVPTPRPSMATVQANAPRARGEAIGG